MRQVIRTWGASAVIGSACRDLCCADDLLLSCPQRARAEDLPDPYKCPVCTGDFQKLLKQYLDNPQTSIQQRDFCDLCGLEGLDKEKRLICCTKCDRAFHAKCGGETDAIFTGNGHWHWQVASML